MYDAGAESRNAREESEGGDCEGSAFCGSASACEIPSAVKLLCNIKLLLSALMSNLCSLGNWLAP